MSKWHHLFAGILLLLGCWGAPAVAAAQDAGVPTAPITATVVTTQGKRLHVRTGPGVNYPIVARLHAGEQAQAVGRDGASQWLQLKRPQLPAGVGWVATQWVTLTAPVAQLPVAPPPSAAPLPVPVPAAPTAGSLSGRIAVPVFAANEGIYNIYVVNADGSGLRLAASQASAPALSYDGARLAYRSWRTDARGIVVANSDGSAPARLTDKLEDVLPAFAPDGKRIVFSSYRESDRKSRLYYVWSDEKNLRAWEWGRGGNFGVDPYWLADGRIVYRALWPASELWVMNGDGTGQQRLYTGLEAVGLNGAPDSNQVAFMANVEGNWDVYALTFGAAAPRRLTSDSARDGLPAWSPDGRAIAFVSDRGGQWGLWVMNADGSNQRLLTLLPGIVDGRVQFEPDYLNHGWVEEQLAWGAY